MILFTSASAVTLIVPTNASAAFPVGTIILYEQAGAGAVTATAAVGVTLNYLSSLSAVTLGQYAVAQLVKTATNTWTLTGAIGG